MTDHKFQVGIIRSGCNIPDFSQDQFALVIDAASKALAARGIFDVEYFTQNIKWPRPPYSYIADEKSAETVRNTFAKIGRLDAAEEMFDKTMDLENSGLLSVNLASDYLTIPERRCINEAIVKAVKAVFPEHKGMHIQSGSYGQAVLKPDLWTPAAA